MPFYRYKMGLVLPSQGSAYHSADGGFPGAAGHMWFLYPLLSVYLLIPILSPWLRQATKRQEQFFLVMYSGIYIPMMHVSLAIPCIAISTYVTCYLTTKVISLLPGSKWIVGI